jgi:hypothetical protein
MKAHGSFDSKALDRILKANHFSKHLGDEKKARGRQSHELSNTR